MEETCDGYEIDEGAFFQEVRRFQERAMRETLHMQFHVFADETDTFVPDPGVALDIYRNLLVEGYAGARLYVELYEDRENDVLVHEDCLLGFGPYPL